MVGQLADRSRSSLPASAERADVSGIPRRQQRRRVTMWRDRTDFHRDDDAAPHDVHHGDGCGVDSSPNDVGHHCAVYVVARPSEAAEAPDVIRFKGNQRVLARAEGGRLPARNLHR